jgi:hypothetical protein
MTIRRRACIFSSKNPQLDRKGEKGREKERKFHRSVGDRYIQRKFVALLVMH